MISTYFDIQNRSIYKFLTFLRSSTQLVYEFLFSLNNKFPALLIVFNLIIVAELSLQNLNSILNIFIIGMLLLFSLYINKEKSFTFRIILFSLYSFICLYIIISKNFQFQVLKSLNEDFNLFNQYQNYEILVKEYDLDLIDNRITGYGSIVSGKYKHLNIYFTLNDLRDIEVGSIIRVSGKAQFIRPETVPGGFDESRWLAQAATYFRLDINPRSEWELLRLVEGKYSILRFIYKIRHFISSKLVEFSGLEAGGLNATMLYGDSTYLTRENKDLFQSLGLAHVLVASGSNVAIVLASGKRLSSKVIKNYQVRSIVHIIILSLYLFLSLGDTSITRAIIMKILEILNKDKYKKIHPINYLNLSVIIMGVFNPYSLLSLGLKLSFMACLAVYTFKSIYKLISKKTTNSDENILRKMCKSLFKRIVFYIYIQLFLLVFLWKPGYKISLVRLFSNLVFLPCFEMILLWSCLFLILICFNLPASVIGFVLNISFAWLVNSFRILLKLSLQIDLSSSFILLIILLVTFFLFRKVIPQFIGIQSKFRGMSYAFIIILTVLLLVNAIFDYSKSGVYFVDVGQGDASIIRSSGKTILIDTGTEVKFNDLNLTLNYLESRVIDYLIITHFDIDHSGGIYKILDNYHVKKIILSSYVEENEEFKELLQYIALNKIKTKIKFVSAGDRIKIRDLVINVVSPSRNYGDKNQGSLCFYTYLKGKSILWTGDIDADVEKNLLAQNALHPVNILHVAHHGSKFSSSEDFLRKIKPQKAIFSAGLNNRYGHPAIEIIARLERNAAEIFRTDTMGTIFLPREWKESPRILCESKYLPPNYAKIIINAKGGKNG